MERLVERRPGRAKDDRISSLTVVEEERPSSLRVGRADDSAEVDADRFADELLGDLQARPTIRRSAHSASRDELGGTAVSGGVENRIRRASGGGQLPAHVRQAAEERSGRDLSGVRVHADHEAADLSATLQATAFTVGSHVFLGADAASPGTAAHDALLGHEVGHVVQQGGGVATRSIQRRDRLTPLGHSARPTVQRAFGKKKGLDYVNSKIEKSKASRVVTMRDLETQIGTLEKALKKLLKHHTSGNQASQSTAYGLRDAASRILDNLPDQRSKASKTLGRTYPAQVKRLQRIIDEAQLIWDEHLVAMTRRKAGNIYTKAGQASGSDTTGSLTKLSGQAKSVGFANLGDRPSEPNDQPAYDSKQAIRDEGAALGLSAGELAAIVTFTASDYKYINPATANSRAWMVAANPTEDKVDKPAKSPEEEAELAEELKKRGMSKQERLDEREKELKTLTGEGALHTGMAMQGLLKMPVWRGKLYRGEVLNESDFKTKFRESATGSFTAATPSIRRTNISSASKEDRIAKAFWFIAANKVQPPHVRILYEMDVNNGRDIEQISAAGHEKEVATLPGAEFVVTSATNQKDFGGYVLVKCVQRA